MRGNLITLRSVLHEDSEHYFRWINDKDLVLLNANYKPVTLNEHHQWFNHLKTNKQLVIFSIVENETNKLIGSCSLRNINTDHLNAELQIRIGEWDYHNKGFGTEAVRLLIEYGFSTMSLQRIYLYVFSDNTRAINAYKKCGFQTEGILKKGALINGHYIDLLLMAIIQ